MHPLLILVGQGEGVLLLPVTLLVVEHHFFLLQNGVHSAGIRVLPEGLNTAVKVRQVFHLKDGIIVLYV